MIANKARGETVLMIDGAPRRLCLTLGALAELECAFEADTIDALAARLGKLSASDLMIVLAALIAGGGEAMSAQQIAAADIDAAAAARAVAEAFQRALT
ncbi:MAG TPA: GTA-gp10 family protein [Caulobacterales bacterium]|nr:GTA-gp10 family protein [Caulobacterales bacterium]